MPDSIREAIRESDLQEIRDGDFQRLLKRAISEGLLDELLQAAGYRTPQILPTFRPIRSIQLWLDRLRIACARSFYRQSF